MRMSFVVLVAFLAGCASGPDVTDEVIQPPTQAQQVNQPVVVKQPVVVTKPAAATKTKAQKQSRCKLLFEQARKNKSKTFGTDWVTSVGGKGALRIENKKNGCWFYLQQKIPPKKSSKG